jgi:hypothetical protein
MAADVSGKPHSTPLLDDDAGGVKAAHRGGPYPGFTDFSAVRLVRSAAVISWSCSVSKTFRWNHDACERACPYGVNSWPDMAISTRSVLERPVELHYQRVGWKNLRSTT